MPSFATMTSSSNPMRRMAVKLSVLYPKNYRTIELPKYQIELEYNRGGLKRKTKVGLLLNKLLFKNRAVYLYRQAGRTTSPWPGR